MKKFNYLLAATIIIISALSLLSISSQAKDSSVLLNENSSIKQWLSPKYATFIPKGIEYANQLIGENSLSDLRSLDYRGLRLTSPYSETIQFALSNFTNCQGSENYHTLSEIIKAGSTNGTDPVTRSSISCDVHGLPNHSAYFDFTALGRLESFTVPVKSEENRNEFLKTLQNKFPNEKIITRCQNGDNCHNEGAGRYYIKKKHLMFKVNFDDRKSFKNGKYYHLYEITLQSDHMNSTYLISKDQQGLKNALTTNIKTKIRTKL